MSRMCLLSVVLIVIGTAMSPAAADDIELSLRYQVETSTGSGRHHRLTRTETWKPEETAVIVCDVWDYHHCLNAVRRLEADLPMPQDVPIDSGDYRKHWSTMPVPSNWAAGSNGVLKDYDGVA